MKLEEARSRFGKKRAVPRPATPPVAPPPETSEPAPEDRRELRFGERGGKTIRLYREAHRRETERLEKARKEMAEKGVSWSRPGEKGLTAPPAPERKSKLWGKVVRFTGRLKTLTRVEAIAKVKSCGGYASTKPVNDNTDFLVCVDRSRMTSKLKRALDMQARGHRIKILTEGQFRSMLSGRA